MSVKRRRLDRTSQPDALHLAQCNLVLCSVVKFGCSRGLVSRHLLRVLQPSFVLQVNGDPGCPPGVTSNGGEKAGRLGPFSNRSPGVVPVKSSSGYGRSSRINALEQRLAAPKACCLNVFVQDLLQQMMHWHFVLFATFFVEPQPPTCAIVIGGFTCSGYPRCLVAGSRREMWNGSRAGVARKSNSTS
jgi:hypothetical protein